LASLRRSFGGDQIRDALGGGQVHFAVQKGPAGELTRLCLAQTSSRKRFHNPGNHATPAMKMKLDRILSRIGSGARKPQHQGLIQGFAINRTQPPQACMARLR
jgi:hypothetical protein